MKHTGLRLFQYAALFKKPILIALLLLAAAVSAELAGPFVAKQMIDRHILGIESPWFETARDDKTVAYDGTFYKRGDHFADSERKGQEVRILQVGRTFVFVDQPIAFDGHRKLEGSELTITKGGDTAVYPVQALDTKQLFAFYEPEFGSLLKLALFYFSFLVLGALFTYGQKYLLQTSANRIIQKMRTDVFAQIQRLPITYFDNQPAGKIVSRITNDTEAIRELYVQVLANFFTGIIYITGIIVALFVLDYRLALFTVPIVPMIYVWILGYRKFASRYNHEIRERLGNINGMIAEGIQGMSIIQVFRRQKETLSEFEEQNKQYFTFQQKMQKLNSITSHNLAYVIRNVFFLGLIWLVGGGSLGLAGIVVTVGVLYAFVDFLNRLFQPVVGIVNQLANLEQALVAADRVFQLLDEEGLPVATESMKRYKGNVTFDNVSFAYKEGEYVLKQLNFEAKPGETVALVGHTGSGKSTILNLLFRFYDIKQGRIAIDGRDIRDIPKQMLRQHMGIVLQDPFLFTGTIASNVSLDDPSISRERVEQALRDVGADEMFRSLPKGIDEPVIEKGSTLSAGQRQLISFARALAFNPAILILDEATASIDTETEAIIQAALEVLKKGRTTFVIAHRLSTIKNADQILVLDHGEIVERGNHEDLMRQQGRYYQMYLLQQGQKQDSSGAGAEAKADFNLNSSQAQVKLEL